MPYDDKPTAVLVLNDGSIFHGQGFGAIGENVGEVCFNTSMTGYQEILTDLSYAGQIINFTFPHIGNTGTNEEDLESVVPAARGMITRQIPTSPSSWRSKSDLNTWMENYNIIGIAGLDTRALTRRIRDLGAPNAVIAHNLEGKFELGTLKEQAQNWPGLNGMDLAKDVTCKETYDWTQSLWARESGYKKAANNNKHVVAIDYGAKLNILRHLAAEGFKVTVVPATTSADDILALKPDGVFLSNGPGDPAATGEYAVPVIQTLMKKNIPIFGICLGHQILALALGGKTRKLALGHRGANHPVKDIIKGHVEITSQNHGFVVVADTFDDTVEQTHISLFDKTNEGLRVKGKPFFSVQHHPEASPGPHDSHALFSQFKEMMRG